jgi:hypothetical protein
MPLILNSGDGCVAIYCARLKENSPAFSRHISPAIFHAQSSSRSRSSHDSSSSPCPPPASPSTSSKFPDPSPSLNASCSASFSHPTSAIACCGRLHVMYGTLTPPTFDTASLRMRKKGLYQLYTIARKSLSTLMPASTTILTTILTSLHDPAASAYLRCSKAPTSSHTLRKGQQQRTRQREPRSGITTSSSSLARRHRRFQTQNRCPAAAS